jgi:hypothetical protein
MTLARVVMDHAHARPGIAYAILAAPNAAIPMAARMRGYARRSASLLLRQDKNYSNSVGSPVQARVCLPPDFREASRG